MADIFIPFPWISVHKTGSNFQFVPNSVPQWCELLQQFQHRPTFDRHMVSSFLDLRFFVGIVGVDVRFYSRHLKLPKYFQYD